jgi:WD40 repeat protein
VLYADFSPDSTRVVTASADNTAGIWDVLTGKLLLPPLRHPFEVSEARFSADGHWIVTASQSQEHGYARVWDAQTGEPLTPSLKQRPFYHAQFVADGRAIFTRTSSGISMLWNLPNEARSSEELGLLANVLSGHQRDFSGAVLPQTSEGLLESYQRLRKLHANDLSASPDEVITWHLREAEASQKAAQWSAAVFHWNELIKLKPHDQAFHDRLERAQDQMNRTNAVPPP